jgi:hypothetical protein
MGGTEVIAIHPADVSFTQGLETLACLSLSERGLLRWYASCCNTPIGNTPRDFRLAYAGLVHGCLENSGLALENSFGPVRMRVNIRSAQGRPRSMPLGTLMSIAQLLVCLLHARLTGSYKSTPFFTPDGTPVVKPVVPGRDERRRAYGPD